MTHYKKKKITSCVEYIMKHKLLQEADLTFREIEEPGKSWFRLSTSHCLTSRCPETEGIFQTEISKHKENTRAKVRVLERENCGYLMYKD